MAALILLVEAAVGMYLPILLRRLQSPQWWLSLLNCFSGGIFLAAGIVHLLPHCAEAQEALGPVGPNGDYPLYLVLVVVGYCVVFYVERVLFDVHGEGHWHCQHSNVFSHSSYYEAISHRAPRGGRHPLGNAGPNSAAGGRPGEPLSCCPPGVLPEAPSHPRSPRLSHLAPHGSALGGARSSGTSGGGGAAAGVGQCGHAPKPPFVPEAATIPRGSECDGAAEVDPQPSCGGKVEPQGRVHKHHHVHQHEACGANEGDAPPPCGPLPPRYPSGIHPAAAPGAAPAVESAPAASCSRAGSTTAASMQTCEEADDDDATAAEVAAAGVGASAGAGLGAGSLPLPAEDVDAESCHSDHSPLAVCVCVEAAEGSASGGAGRGGNGHDHHDHDHQHQHDHGHRHRRMGERRSAQALYSGSDAGAAAAEALCAPLLDAVAFNADGGAAATPPLPSVALALPDCCGDVGGDLRGLAWAHLHQQHVQQLQEQEAAEEEAGLGRAADCGHYHNNGPWHRRHSADCGVADGSLASGLLQGPQLSPRHSHPHRLTRSHSNGHGHGHPHARHGHHAIKPRFRFMHGVVLLVALALHTALECIALGLVDERGQFMVLFVAIASHKAVSALALSSRFLKEGATMMQVTAYVGPFCLIAPLSILLGVYVGRVAPLARLVFSCFATGTFLYVGASEVIMEEFEGEMRADRRDISTRAARYIKFAAVLLAVGLVAASGLLPDAD